MAKKKVKRKTGVKKWSAGWWAQQDKKLRKEWGY
jgi:hypothetical protein